jgi:hypothetical protein
MATQYIPATKDSYWLGAPITSWVPMHNFIDGLGRSVPPLRVEVSARKLNFPELDRSYFKDALPKGLDYIALLEQVRGVKIICREAELPTCCGAPVVPVRPSTSCAACGRPMDRYRSPRRENGYRRESHLAQTMARGWGMPGWTLQGETLYVPASLSPLRGLSFDVDLSYCSTPGAALDLSFELRAEGVSSKEIVRSAELVVASPQESMTLVSRGRATTFADLTPVEALPVFRTLAHLVAGEGDLLLDGTRFVPIGGSIRSGVLREVDKIKLLSGSLQPLVTALGKELPLTLTGGAHRLVLGEDEIHLTCLASAEAVHTARKARFLRQFAMT